MHQSVLQSSAAFSSGKHRYNYVNSSKYLDLLNVFKTLLSKKRSENEGLMLRLIKGLEKLNLVSDTVSEIQQNLTATVPILEHTTVEMEGLMVELTEKRKEAERTRAGVKEEEEKSTLAAAEAKELAESAEAQLAEALPALQSAIKAVGKLSRKDIIIFYLGVVIAMLYYYMICSDILICLDLIGDLI